MKARFLAGFAAGCGAVVLGVVVLAFIPATSLEGVDAAVTRHRISLLEKGGRFWLRHAEFQRLAEAAAGGETDPQRRVLKLLDWTGTMVRPMPPGVPVIDDHILHIVLRHYGNTTQMAEVFTALTTYIGNHGKWEVSTPPGAQAQMALSFVESEDGWWVFDVEHGAWFETETGRIATVPDFRHPEQLRRRGQAPEELGGMPYVTYFQNVEEVRKRSFSRARPNALASPSNGAGN
jgi:hypothetical protein